MALTYQRLTQFRRWAQEDPSAHPLIRRAWALLPPADRLVDYLEDFAALYKLRIAYGQRVEMVRREEGRETGWV